jgi:hypothetical protein
MTIENLREQGLILFEAISGSRAYGTNKPTSDTDYRGVYILPMDNLLGFNYIEQVADNTNDCVYYEVGRFLQLLQTQNPNIIELLNMPEENITYKHPLFDLILAEKPNFISKVCRDSFGGYAVAQIQKARGLNKKIVNPMAKERKSILDFCHVVAGYDTIPLRNWLEARDYTQDRCGLVNLPHARDVYALFYETDDMPQVMTFDSEVVDGEVTTKVVDAVYDSGEKITVKYRGIMNADETSNEVRLSSIPLGQLSVGTMIYNKDGYTKYCKDYKAYWDWDEKKNQDRFNTNMEHGKGYDSKNMMHCIRLVRMAVEIAEQKKVIVRRPDAAELMLIRNGEAEYEALLAEAESQIKYLDEAYANSDLPDKIDRDFVNDLLIKFRKKYYAECFETA